MNRWTLCVMVAGLAFGASGCGIFMAAQAVEQQQQQMAQMQADAMERQKVAQAQATKLQAEAEHKRTHWNMSTTKSALDSSTNVHAGKLAAASFRDRFEEIQWPIMAIVCEEGKLKVGLKTFSLFNDSSMDKTWKRTALTVRFGDAEAKEVTALIGDDNKSAWLDEPHAVLDQLSASPTAVIKFIPNGREAVVATFDNKGLQDVLPTVQSSCPAP